MRLRGFIGASLLASATGLASMAQAAPLNMADTPLSVLQVKPPVMVMFDNSGSMKSRMYPDGYDSTLDYHGIFQADQNYEYDESIPVNADAYDVAVDTGQTGAFVASDCSPSAQDFTCWSGRYLNWLTTRRIDSSRRVLVGGKTESAEPFDYGGDYRYKIVGNNEPEDGQRPSTRFSREFSGSSAVSPVPDGQAVIVSSPAHSGEQRAVYRPHATMTFGGGGLIRDAVGNVIGVFGRRTVDADLGQPGLSDDVWDRVAFGESLDDPIVVAKSISHEGDRPALLRVQEVDGSGFEVSIQEWGYQDGDHVAEQVGYIAFERGVHTLSGGATVQAGRTTTDAEVSSACDSPAMASDGVAFAQSFSDEPTVISTVSDYGTGTQDAVVTRVSDVETSGFRLSLQRQENASDLGALDFPHRVDFIAVERGRAGDDGNGTVVEAGVQAGVTDAETGINYSQPFSQPPVLVTDLQTLNGADTASLRHSGRGTAAAGRVLIEEEQSCDPETDHVQEDVGYVALADHGPMNVALAVEDKPTGLLQGIQDDVRLGVSFYRFPPESGNIYAGNLSHGGTLQFQIPRNPFVREPTAEPGDGMSHTPGYRELDGYIGAPIDAIVDAVNNYPLVWGTTPIAENLWEVIQYFEQDAPYYDSEDPIAGARADFRPADGAASERDPFHYPDHGEHLSCTSPSVIVFTDGFPIADAYIPSSIRDYDNDNADGDEALRERDGAGWDNLDDVAEWAYCDNSTGSCDGADGTRDLRDDLENNQYLTVHTVGFADGAVRQILQDTADNAGGEAYAAQDGKTLKDVLRQTFATIASRSSASSVSLNSGAITGDSRVYKAVFNSNVWSGDIEAFNVNESDGSVDADTVWVASEEMPAPSDRTIISYGDDAEEGVEFSWSSLTAEQQTALGSRAVLEYLRGDQSGEQRSGGSFRNRRTLLGDFVHASPKWVGPPDSGYRPDDMEGDTNLYSDFVDSRQNRAELVYAGANDGMLHAFDAGTGEERFAYIPSMVMPELSRLADPGYSHRYYVDGAPMVADAFFGGSWHTVLTAGLRAGGQGIYALDVTNPPEFDSAGTAVDNVLWEFDDTDHRDLGFTFSRPHIGRLATDEWGVIFGNGYNNTAADGNPSATGNAVLYVVNAQNGNVIKAIDTNVGTAQDPTGQSRPNGLSTPALVDTDSDPNVDYVYAGDLFGNLWKFDLNSDNPRQWGVANSGDPLFTACSGSSCATSQPQPITVRPEVGFHPHEDGFMVYFGTGKYFEAGDDSAQSQTTQSFYGIWDKGDNKNGDITRGDLVAQEVEAEVDRDSDGDDDYRIVSDRPVDWEEDLGWYIDLTSPSGDNRGERQISAPVLRNNDRVIFSTMMPNPEACAAAGSSWLMELSVSNGGPLEFSPFDVNDDRDFDDADFLDSGPDGGMEVAPSGRQSEVGVIGTPGILSDLSDPSRVREFKYTSGSSGRTESILENPGPSSSGRRSWRQIR